MLHFVTIKVWTQSLMSDMLGILHTTVIKISLFLILLKKNKRVTLCNHILCYFTSYLSYIRVVLCPSSGVRPFVCPFICLPRRSTTTCCCFAAYRLLIDVCHLPQPGRSIDGADSLQTDGRRDTRSLHRRLPHAILKGKYLGVFVIWYVKHRKMNNHLKAKFPSNIRATNY